MVCIAAFIILAIVGIFVAFLSIFRRDIGRKYWKVFKKSTSCFTKHITFQKCDTNFKDDVKNTLLRKVVIKHPKAVKPLSVTIEIVSILIVLTTVWSLVEGAKAGLALWTLGTCNVRRPAQCSLSSNIGCSIDAGEEAKNPIEAIGNWFSEWGEIFEAVPDKFKDWNQYFYSLEAFLWRISLAWINRRPWISSTQAVRFALSPSKRSSKVVSSKTMKLSSFRLRFKTKMAVTNLRILR